MRLDVRAASSSDNLTAYSLVDVVIHHCFVLFCKCRVTLETLLELLQSFLSLCPIVWKYGVFVSPQQANFVSSIL